MIFIDESIPDGPAFNSFMKYIGGGNTAVPLIANPTQCLFVKGAAADVTVKLQAAVIPTPADQSIQPVDADFIDVATYTGNTITSFPTLNGLWVRFQINNTSGAPADVTCLLE